MLFFYLLLYLITLLPLVSAKKRCVILLDSTVCSAFSQFYVDLSALGNTYPFLYNATTVQDFDRGLIQFANSTNMYLFDLGCLSTNFNADVPYARYSLTRLCAQMLQDAGSLDCNLNNDLVPPPLCQTTCDQWVESVTKITENPRVCTSSSQRNTTLDNYWMQCQDWSGFNGTVENNCISGIANEPYTCGFKSDLQQACRYCKYNSNDECCQSVQCDAHLSGGAIAGIVVGCIVFTVLVLLCCLFLYRKKKHHYTPALIQKFMPSSSTSSEFHASESTKVEKSNQSVKDHIAIPSHTVSPPYNMNHLSTSSAIHPLSSPFSDEFFVVIHPYSPQMEDELALSIGDIVCVAVQFDDGWALGFNVTTGLKGAFPMVCISPAPTESLDRILNMDEYASTTPSSMQHSQDTLQHTINRIRDNMSRSFSLSSYNSNNISSFNTIPSHLSNTVPKRSGSAKSYDYSDCESPSSPTVNTPFFHSSNHLQQSHLHKKDSI